MKKMSAAFAACAVAFAPLAHADDTDTIYLNTLHDRGITNANGDQGLIDFGHKVCGLLADGYSMDAITDVGDLNERNGISDDDVKFMVRTAAASYCPQLIH